MAVTDKARIDYSKQKTIIDSFPEPQNDYERVDYNLKCQIMYEGKDAKNYLADIISLLAIPFFIVAYCINRIFCNVKKTDSLGRTIIVEAGNRKGKQYDFRGRVPDLPQEYEPVYEYTTEVFPKMTKGVMGWKAFKMFVRFASRHPFSGFINLRCLINLAGYYRLLLLYSPCTIANFRMELNPMSSLITCLCESFDCEFFCFMHGEAMINMRYAFIRFSKFYIWDEHYADVFGWARCAENQYIVFTPGIYRRTIDPIPEPRYYITYYLSGDEAFDSGGSGLQIAELLNRLTQSGHKCKIRPHPRWSDINSINKVINGTGIELENPSAVSVEESILDSEIVAGTYSTVLSQAYYLGKKVYIDDLSNKDLIDELRERKLFLFSKDINLVSELADRGKEGV